MNVVRVAAAERPEGGGSDAVDVALGAAAVTPRTCNRAATILSLLFITGCHVRIVNIDSEFSQ